MTTLNASEAGLRALIQRHLRKPSKSNMDRDKVDFLLVQYFALCAPPKVYHKQIELEDVAQVMKPVLGEASTAPISWCEPLEKMIVALRGFRSLRDMLKTSFVEQGRKVKDEAGKMFYEPASFVAFVRFNFLMRRTLIELMHADLIAIRAGLSQLDSLDVKALDCRLFGLSTLRADRSRSPSWRMSGNSHSSRNTPNGRSTRRSRNCCACAPTLNKALEKVAPKSAEGAGSISPAPLHARKKPRGARRNQPPRNPRKTASTLNVLDFEACLEQIWEQLIAVPPTRGRSMTTVKVGSARILDVVVGSDRIHQRKRPFGRRSAPRRRRACHRHGSHGIGT